ncbi:MAG: class I SAM-dependent methyltransferase [Myxococcota bacterium]
MKLQLMPENDAEKAIFASGQMPELAMTTWMGGCASYLMAAGVKLGIFEALAEGPRTADALSEDLGFDRHGLKVLLEGLTGFGALRRKEGTFELSADARQWLLREAPTSLAPMVALFGTIQSWLGGLESAVRTGEVTNFHFNTDAQGWTDYLGLLDASGRFDAPALIDTLGLSEPPKRMLDVAGGPGRYSIALAQAYEQLDIDILDLEPSAREGRTNIAAAGLDERIRYHVGDMFEHDWPAGPYDLVLVSHFLHCLTESRCRQILGRAVEQLGPGGRLAIHEVYIGGEEDELSAHSVSFSLVYYTGTGGRCWPMDTYQQWLSDAGLHDVVARRTPAGAVVVLGTKA